MRGWRTNRSADRHALHLAAGQTVSLPVHEMLYPHDRRCPCNPVSDRRPRQAARWRFEWEFNRYQLAPQRLKLAGARGVRRRALGPRRSRLARRLAAGTNPRRVDKKRARGINELKRRPPLRCANRPNCAFWVGARPCFCPTDSPNCVAARGAGLTSRLEHPTIAEFVDSAVRSDVPRAYPRITEGDRRHEPLDPAMFRLALQGIAAPFGIMASNMLTTLPQGRHRSLALLLEAREVAVCAATVEEPA
jgi:hypothetical protein